MQLVCYSVRHMHVTIFVLCWNMSIVNEDELFSDLENGVEHAAGHL